VKIFVFPPGREVLETRLRARGTESPESVSRRLAVAAREMAEFGEYDYAIINDRLERAADDLRAILLAQRARSQRRRGELEAILKTFSP
jgi:guanylate kinase